MTAIKRGLVLIVMLGCWAGATATRSEGRPPNVVLILTDNQGAWTLGCYGNPEPRLPGHSYDGSLNGKHDAWDDTVFFEYENTRSVRTDEWKYVGRFPDGPNELYNLRSDPGERRNVIDQPAHAAQQKELRGRLDEFFDRYADPLYDLSRGGRSKADRRSR